MFCCGDLGLGEPNLDRRVQVAFVLLVLKGSLFESCKLERGDSGVGLMG